jgi:hypothetical protein
MIKFKSKFAAAAALLVLSIGAFQMVGAQVEQGTSLRFFVESDFVINGETFPAGEYTIQRTPNTSDAPSVLMIRGANSMIFDTAVSDSRVTADRTELLFENLDGVNYLSAIVVEGHTQRNELLSARVQAR